MSFIGSAISSVVGAVSSIFGGSTGSILSSLPGGLLSEGESLFGSIASGVTSLISDSGSELSSLYDAAKSALSSLFNSGFTTFLHSVSPIISDIDEGIKKVSAVENEVISPISSLVGDISNTLQTFDDTVVAPIRNLIDGYNTASNALLHTVANDINEGFTGILKVPQDLANAMTSTSADFSRAMQELAVNNQSIVSGTLVPGLSLGIGKHLDDITTTLKSAEYQKTYTPYSNRLLSIGSYDDYTHTIAENESIIDSILNYKGWPGELITVIWDFLRETYYLGINMELSLEPVKQAGRSKNPYTLLSPGEATEAYRRGIIDLDTWHAEMLRSGVNLDRQAVLSELADFLFAPRDAAEMLARGIISKDDATVIYEQNKLNPDQFAALQEIIQHPLSPADVAAGVARGYISADQAAGMYQAALVPPSVIDIIPELELTLRNPVKMARLTALGQQVENGFLSGTLSTPVPDNVQGQYDRAQAEAGSAQLDWLDHWDIPKARWWVVAYFRGLRTLTQVHQAFAALNIPEELWDDIIETERELPPTWLVPDIVKSGVWSAEQAIPTLMQLGFTEENATVLYNYGAASIKSAKASVASDLAKVSLGNARSAFDDGLVTADEYKSILLAHGYSDTAAALTVEISEYELARAQIKDEAETIVKQVQLGVIDKGQAQSQLYNLGLSTLQVATYMQQIEKAKIDGAKLPSEAHLEALYKKSLIDESTAVATLQLIGYSETWANLLIKLW